MRVEVNLQGLYGLETIHGVFLGSVGSSPGAFRATSCLLR